MEARVIRDLGAERKERVVFRRNFLENVIMNDDALTGKPQSFWGAQAGPWNCPGGGDISPAGNCGLVVDENNRRIEKTFTADTVS